MMSRFNSKITDNKFFKKLNYTFLFLVFLPVFSYAKLYTQTLTISNINDENQNNSVIETEYKNTIYSYEDENDNQIKETKQKEKSILNNPVLQNPYLYAPYSNVIYTATPPYNKFFKVGGYSYYGYDFPSAYKIPGYYYDTNGKKYYRAPVEHYIISPNPDSSLPPAAIPIPPHHHHMPHSPQNPHNKQ